MKKNFNWNLIKFIILSTGILLINLGCQNDLNNSVAETVGDSAFHRISLNELKSRLVDKDFDKLSTFFDKNYSNIIEDNRLEQSDNPVILTDEIIMIESEENTFFTFGIGTDTTSNEFYNLVVSVDSFGSILTMRILEYTPSDNWSIDLGTPFNGTIKLIENNLFNTDEIQNMLNTMSSISDCIIGMDYRWNCGAGNNHGPGHPNCAPENNAVTEFIIIPIYGPCPQEIDAGDSSTGGGFPVGDYDDNDLGAGGGNSSGSSGGNDGSSNPPDDGVDCLTDANGNCLTDETSPIPPREQPDEEDCLPYFSCRYGEIMDEDCECRIDLENPCANKDLINYEVSTGVVSMIESRQQPNTMVQSSELVDSFILETIDDGWGDVNQDRYSIKINELPNGYTPFQLFNEIRMNFTNLIVGGDVPYITDVTLEPYSDEDGIIWNSDNPVGTAMDFDTIFDTSTVYCVEYNQDQMYWIFATVTSYDHQGHFVAGVRQFGLEPNGSGGYSFYVRAADRLGGILDYIANGLSGEDEVLFTQAADKTWKNLMENTASLIQNQGGDVDEFDETKTYGTRHPYNEDDCQD